LRRHLCLTTHHFSRGRYYLSRFMVDWQTLVNPSSAAASLRVLNVGRIA
jgi:hypothetical protein